MNKVIFEFNSIPAAIEWAKRIAKDPESLLTDGGGWQQVPEPGKVKETKLEKVKDTPKEEKAAEKPAAGVSQMMTDLKEAGVKLTDFNPSRYDGVQAVLAKYGVDKIKDLDEDQQGEVLKMWNKMLAADKGKYADMLAFVKGE